MPASSSSGIGKPALGDRDRAWRPRVPIRVADGHRVVRPGSHDLAQAPAPRPIDANLAHQASRTTDSSRTLRLDPARSRGVSGITWRSARCRSPSGCSRSARRRPSSSPPVRAGGNARSGDPSAATPAPATGRAGQRGRQRRGQREAPSEALNTDYKACVAFDTGGLGDKGFNDLAKKGLDDAKALGFDDRVGRGAGLDRLRGQHPAADRRGLPDDHHGRLPAGRRRPPRRPSPTRTSRSGRSTPPGTPRATTSPPAPPTIRLRASRRTSPASTTRSTRPRCSPATSPRAGARPARSATYGGLAFPGVTRFMDGLYAGVQYYNQQKGKTVEVLGWDGSLKDPTTTGTFVGGSGGTDTWNDPAKGEQFAKTFLDQGVDIVHPVAGETGNGTIKAMLAAGKWAVGVDNDQAITIARRTAGAILTSAQKAIDVSVLDVIKKTSGGDLGGEDYSGHARQQRRAPGAVPRVRQPDPGRDQGRARGAEGGDRRRQRQGLQLPRHAAASRSRANRRATTTAPGPPRGPGAVSHHDLEGLADAARTARHHQAVPGRPRERRDLDLGRPRQGARPAGRERRRQDDPHEHPVRACTSRTRARSSSTARSGSSTIPRPPSTPASAWSTSTSCSSRSSTSSRPSRSAPRRSRTASAASTVPRRASGSSSLSDQYKLGRRPRRQDREPAGRRPPARRDPQGALSPERHPRPRRAERRPHAVRDRGAVRDHPVPDGDRHDDHLHHPQAQRGPRGRRRASSSCAVGGSPARADPKTATRQELANLMVGRDVELIVPKGPAKPGDVVLSLRGAQVRDDRLELAVNGVDLDVRAGRDRRHRRRPGQRADRAGRGDRRAPLVRLGRGDDRGPPHREGDAARRSRTWASPTSRRTAAATG